MKTQHKKKEWERYICGRGIDNYIILNRKPKDNLTYCKIFLYIYRKRNKRNEFE